ncbi:UNVERIFIED_CONTAM: WAT1-related protein [Sesamum radiatum]|uniref:WAT1-related protein n=1 Tax=Sesamum radiatum TaxID=300843 RepID=A0AAW2RX61_SESRA
MEGDFLPFLAMVIVQLGYAGMNIISKLAMDSGMNPFVHVAYRQVFATVAIAPFAYFMERVTVNQITYFVGLKNSTPTIACALTNINPAVTFIMALPFRLEKLGVKSKAGQAKILGTILCVGGALLLSFYHGSVVNIGDSSIHWSYAQKTGTNNSINHVNLILGPFLLIVSAVSWAVWLIIQTRVSQKYAAPYSSSALMCLMAKRKGPLYVSVFSPLLLVIVAVLSWALLEEKLYIGTVAGSVLIVLGLYGVLWGKNREMRCIYHVEEVDKEAQTTAYDLESLSSHQSKSGIDAFHVTS